MSHDFYVLALGACVLLAGVLLGACRGEARTDAEVSADTIAEQLLDEERADEERRALVDAHLEQAVDILRALVRDLEAGTEEEARRIPWVWRVTIEATGRNDAEQIRRLIEVALPAMDVPLLNWQGVVLGGGIVNGISRSGRWPRTRIHEVLAGHDSLQARWQHAVDRAYAMAEDPDVPYPWRYDALRMVAMDAQGESIPALSSYLEPNLDDHLHMGAISGLADIRSPEVPGLLLSGWSYYSERNRNLALDGMLRTEARVEALLDAVAEGTFSADDLGEQRVEQLKEHENDAVRHRVQELMSNEPGPN